jgi:hypothetical protein
MKLSLVSGNRLNMLIPWSLLLRTHCYIHDGCHDSQSLTADGTKGVTIFIILQKYCVCFLQAPVHLFVLSSAQYTHDYIFTYDLKLKSCILPHFAVLDVRPQFHSSSFLINVLQCLIILRMTAYPPLPGCTPLAVLNIMHANSQMELKAAIP